MLTIFFNIKKIQVSDFTFIIALHASIQKTPIQTIWDLSYPNPFPPDFGQWFTNCKVMASITILSDSNLQKSHVKSKNYLQNLV